MGRAFPGEHRLWVAAGGVLALFLAVAIVAAIVPRDRYTGTNSVGVRSAVAELEADERLCVPQLDVPDGTGRVRMRVFWQGDRRPRLDVRLRAGQRVRTGTVAAVDRRGTAGGDAVDVPLAKVSLEPPSVPGSLCVVPREAGASFGGMEELQGDQRSPTVDGKPLGSRVAVWFLPPPGEQQSAFSAFDDILERASLFRPGWVGPWIYVALLVAWLALAYGSIRLLSGHRGVARTAVGIALIAAGSAGGWALITPPFGAPDEPDHFGYAQALAERGEPPDKAQGSRAPYSSRATVALDALRVYSQVELPEARSPWLEVAEDRWRKRNGAESLAADNGGGYLTSTSTHAPPYYALTLPAYAAAGPKDTFSALTAMRLISVLLGAVTAACAFLTVRELAPGHERLAVVAGLVVAFQPMFAFISGSVNNDNGVNAAAALLIYLLVRGLRRGLTVPIGLAIGTVLVLLPLMKGTGYALYPAALVGLGGMLWRRHAKRDLAAYVGVAGAFAGFTLLWTSLSETFGRTAFTTPGGLSPTSSEGIVGNVIANPGLYLSYLWQVFLPRLPFMSDLHAQRLPAFDIYIERGWAAFGWYAIKFPRGVYVVLALAVLGGFALCAVVLWRERARTRSRGWELAVLVLVLAGVIGGVEAAYVVSAPRPVVAEQGRYAFTAMVPLATVAAGACLGLGARRTPVVATVLVAAMIGFAFLSQLLALSGFYA